MAKARNFFGLRTGSTKSKTYSILNGWQIEKDRVYGGKNPRTNAQMRQRMIMATASAAYSGMREIVDHSFEGVTYGQPTMSKFISENAKMLKKALLSGNSSVSYNPYQNRNVLPNPYIISKGSLNSGNKLVGLEGDDSLFICSWQYPSEITEQTTLREFLNIIGISENGYVTFLAVAYSSEIGLSQFGWLRLYPKKEEFDSVIWDEEIKARFDIESNVPVDLDSPISSTEQVQIIFDFDQGGINHGSSAVILSDKRISWKRSNAVMHVMDDATSIPASDALATYPVGSDYVLNGGSI